MKEEEEINSFEKKKKCDQGKKSTRRRIYDALNVMIAVGLVGKRR